MDTRGNLGSRILVPLDGSTFAKQALPHAQTLATSNAEMVLLEVVPEPTVTGDPCGKITLAIDAIVSLSQETARQDLADVAAPLRRSSPDLTVDCAVARGDAAEQILRVARDRKATLIVMTSRGRGAIQRPLLGNVAERVVKNARVPVMIVRSTTVPLDGIAARIRRLVVPLDGSALSVQAVPVAEELAKRLNVPICLVSVVDVARATSPAIACCVAQDQARSHELFGRLQVDAQRALEQTGARLMLAGMPTTWTMVMGPTARSIGEATCPGDVVVMASRGQRPATRWDLGSIAERLVHDCPVPVIVLPATPPAEIIVSAMAEVAGLEPVAAM